MPASVARIEAHIRPPASRPRFLQQALGPSGPQNFRGATKTVPIAKSDREQLGENLSRVREAQEQHDAGSWQ